MSNIFVFNPDEFKEIFPQFNKLTNKQLEWFFETAESLLDNSKSSCISLKERKKLFFYLVAHLAELQGRIDDGNSSLVGRVSSASEGSVSISTEMPMGTGAQEQWLKQTPYGAQYYVLIRKYLTAILIQTNAPMPVNRSRWHYGRW